MLISVRYRYGILHHFPCKNLVVCGSDGDPDQDPSNPYNKVLALLDMDPYIINGSGSSHVKN